MAGYRQGQPPANKGRRRTPEPFTQEEVLAIVRQTSRRGPAGFRDRALIVVLWRTGLRISEALNLRPRDLDLEHGLLRVRHGKGDKFRIVGIEPAAVAELESWLARRAELPNLKAGGFVFCTISQPEPGSRMGAPQFRTKLKLLAARAGIDKDVDDVYPHQFRHTHATELVHEGQPLAVVKEQLGHDHLSTTEHYVGRLAPARRIQAIRERPGFQI